MSDHKSIPEMSVDTQVLIRRLSTVAVGEVVTYEELSGLIGRDVQDSARHLLMSARNRLQRDEQMLFGPIVNEGLKRLDNSAKLGEAVRGREGMRRQARRVIGKLSCVDYEALTKPEQQQHNLTAATTGAMLQMSKPSTMKKLESRMADRAAAAPAKFLQAIRETL